MAKRYCPRDLFYGEADYDIQPNKDERPRSYYWDGDPMHRLYIRISLPHNYGEAAKRKWVPIGWYCQKCGHHEIEGVPEEAS